MDYYAILGVHPTAEDIVIRAAYKALAQRYHPDRFAGSQDEAHRRMSELTKAYDVLADPVRRQKYDRRRLTYTQSVATYFNGSAKFPPPVLDPRELRSAAATRKRSRIALSALMIAVVVLSAFNLVQYSGQIKDWLSASLPASSTTTDADSRRIARGFLRTQGRRGACGGTAKRDRRRDPGSGHRAERRGRRGRPRCRRADCQGVRRNRAATSRRRGPSRDAHPGCGVDRRCAACRRTGALSLRRPLTTPGGRHLRPARCRNRCRRAARRSDAAHGRPARRRSDRSREKRAGRSSDHDPARHVAHPSPAGTRSPRSACAVRVQPQGTNDMIKKAGNRSRGAPDSCCRARRRWPRWSTRS